VITPLNPRNLGPAVRATNERLMHAFIQADLPRRVGLDTRRSVVLYDGNFLFSYALDALPNERARCITKRRFAIGRRESDVDNDRA
jgi:hypothetical protein